MCFLVSSLSVLLFVCDVGDALGHSFASFENAKPHFELESYLNSHLAKHHVGATESIALRAKCDCSLVLLCLVHIDHYWKKVNMNILDFCFTKVMTVSTHILVLRLKSILIY